MGDITILIQRAREGDRSALDDLFEALYPELHRLARGRVRRGPQQTLLDTTALVNECYLKLSAAGRLLPGDRNHFLAYCASAMRSIIVDFARARATKRRGGVAEHLTLNTEIIDGTPSGEVEILKVHEALEQLARLDARLVRVVEMRYFVGMTDLEIAEALNVTDRTVRRDWDKARLLLAAALRQ